MAICIWCKEDNKPAALEHIIPESMGCPDQFVLKDGEVCKPCNNHLAYLDKAVIDSFDVFLFLAGIPRKKNRKPTINSRGNMVAMNLNGENTMFVNMDPTEVTFPPGVRVAGRGKSTRNINFTFNEDGSVADFSFSTTIGDDPRFIRGIYKIAFETVAYFLGPNILLTAAYDPLRQFVIHGKPARKLVLLHGFVSHQEGFPPYRHQVLPPFTMEGHEGFVVRMHLGVLEFWLDLTKNGSAINRICKEAENLFGNTGWSCLPP
jgi:hypothetical protein